jgi:mutator protein MutT
MTQEPPPDLDPPETGPGTPPPPTPGTPSGTPSPAPAGSPVTGTETTPSAPAASARIEIAAAALVRHDADGVHVLIARRHASAVRGDLWELPGGKCDAGEDARTAAARELMEEADVAVRAEDGTVIGRVEQDDPHMQRERSIALTLVAFRAPPGASPRAVASAECRWERIDRLDGYEWPAANLRLNAMLLQWVTANPER